VWLSGLILIGMAGWIARRKARNRPRPRTSGEREKAGQGTMDFDAFDAALVKRRTSWASRTPARSSDSFAGL